MNRVTGGIFPCGGTGGHLDEYARFVGPQTILLAEVLPEDRNHPIGRISHDNMEENYKILLNERDQDGEPFKVIRMPMPPLLTHFIVPSDDVYKFFHENLNFQDGTTLDNESGFDMVVAASYCNFLISNGVVLVSKYSKGGKSPRFQETDDIAKKILADLFPDRKIAQIDAYNINLGGGGMHCISQQEPK